MSWAPFGLPHHLEFTNTPITTSFLNTFLSPHSMPQQVNFSLFQVHAPGFPTFLLLLKFFPPSGMPFCLFPCQISKYYWFLRPCARFFSSLKSSLICSAGDGHHILFSWWKILFVDICFLKAKFLSILSLYSQPVTCDFVSNSHLFIYSINEWTNHDRVLNCIRCYIERWAGELYLLI